MHKLTRNIAIGFLVVGASATSALAGPGGGGMRGGGAMAPMGHMAPMAASRVNPSTSNSTTAHTAQPKAKGQPNQSCGSASAPNTPGNAASAPGSAFNPDGNAGTHYAGQQPQNSRNPASVAQYDVACSNQAGGAR